MSHRDLLALRPTSVQRRLGDSSSTLLISGADLSRAAAKAGVSICSVDLVRLELLPGVMRAAEELDVPLQIEVDAPWEEVGEAASAALIRALVGVADRARYSGPLAIAAVLDLTSEDETLEESTGTLLTLVEAGFTSFLLPMPGSRDALTLTLGLIELVGQHGLGVEVIDVPPGGADSALELFRRCGRLPCALVEAGEGAVRLVDLAGAAEPERSTQVGLRRALFAGIVARHLDVEPDEVSFAPIDANAGERMEAMAYIEARTQFRRSRMIGSGSSCLAQLAWLE